MTCKEYSNKALKEQAYAELTQYVKTSNPQASKDTVTKKIANLRTAFGKEYKKVESSKVSGAGAQDIILPKLWYYEDLMFLKAKTQCEKLVQMSRRTQHRRYWMASTRSMKQKR